MLKAMDVKDLPKPVMMALRSKDRQSKNTVELLQWIKDLSPELRTEN
jgi:hypothetical protein